MALSATQGGWKKLVASSSDSGVQYWDAIHYYNLAKEAACSAFYPLWPLLSGNATRVAIGTENLGAQILLSEVIFLLSLPLALFTFRRVIDNKKIAFLMSAMYALGPNSIFFSIGYTESLFSFLGLILILALHLSLKCSQAKSYSLSLVVLLLVAALASLTRPSIIQASFACLFCLTGLAATGNTDWQKKRKVLSPLLCILTGSIVGYSLYGSFCVQAIGDFLGPFKAQADWGKTLAFRPWLLVTPRSLLIDLHGLYLPALLLLFTIASLWSRLKGKQTLTLNLPAKPILYLLLAHPLIFTCAHSACRRKKKWYVAHKVNLAKAAPKLLDPVFLYCLGFSGIHSAINLAFNAGYLYSTSRYFFGTPFAFIAIGTVLSATNSRLVNRVTIAVGIVGMALLTLQWMNWANGKWVG